MSAVAEITKSEPVAGRRERVTGEGASQPTPVAFTIPTPPSANALFRNVKGVGRVKAKRYDDFVRMAVTAIRGQGIRPIAGNVVAIFGVERMSDRADIDNRIKAMLDAIVEAKTIEDDRFVTALAISWLPSANGMSHVRLLPVQRLDVSFHPSTNGATGGWFINAPDQEEEERHGHFTG
ncbi:RusA family crossover junction endodeoxyribonuclease [Aurantimonas endophytica]|uniref:Holliday junction resolvase RusA-like endonuclease n=1 Tax=Aurantimonas endophytica TaxID=1522175 RepID=A0A7W6HFY7_9HYPH|nr:RusA family crossover junction endodeoxyribonuclease [Aurantimonas endophytica]MBB4004451.1 Holliday junction resolvase RusA-like endonuclease [Aurantimonas endophytica]MCO6405287.1 RusA family crossover junction endodeoxyribonuclease [Aurantimonas endophytica]